VFWWRMSNEFLPSRANLHQRHIEQMSLCTSCGVEAETTYHALVKCSYAYHLWRSLADLTGVKLPNLHPATWTVDLLNDKICAEKDRCVILCGMWSLWGARNDRKHGKSPILMKHAVDWAMDVFFHLIKVVDRGNLKDDPSGEHQWKKHEPGYLKINTDGAYDVAVIRNEDGTFVKAISRRLPHVASSVRWSEATRTNTPACDFGD
jgi:hypothetical protein